MGHAYYANYLFWFEQARGAWCRERGWTYKQMEELGYKIPVVEAHAEYKGEVLYDDLVIVKVWVSHLRRASIRFDYEIINTSTGQLTTTGYTWHVLIGQSRKAVTMPAIIREWLTRDPAEFETIG